VVRPGLFLLGRGFLFRTPMLDYMHHVYSSRQSGALYVASYRDPNNRSSRRTGIPLDTYASVDQLRVQQSRIDVPMEWQISPCRAATIRGRYWFGAALDSDQVDPQKVAFARKPSKTKGRKHAYTRSTFKIQLPSPSARNNVS
jgi:hypothetical protein